MNTQNIILIALVMIMNCQAQKFYTNQTRTESNGVITYKDFKQVTDTTYDRLIFLSDFNDYAKHCYNDSTLKKYHRFMNSDTSYCISYDDHVCVQESHYVTVWEHKEPTFSDFIKWTNRRKEK